MIGKTMPTKLNLLGQVFGSLTAIEELDHNIVNGDIRKGHYYRCSCKCGGESVVSARHLRRSVRECVKCPTNNIKLELEGKVLSTKKYGDFKVIKYTNSSNIDVQFVETGYITTSHIKEVRKGSIKDPTRPSVYGVGYVGVGPHRCTIAESSKINSPAYEVWIGMIKRCYSENINVRNKAKSYRDVTVCKDWHNFQNFAEWFTNNLPDYSNPELDKDLKVIGNKEYSSTACSFVPYQINALFGGSNRVSELPRGVHFCNSKKKYIVQVQAGEFTKNGNPKQTCLGAYDNLEEAKDAYVNAKVKIVHDLANMYKDILDNDVYLNLINNTTLFF